MGKIISEFYAVFFVYLNMWISYLKTEQYVEAGLRCVKSVKPGV